MKKIHFNIVTILFVAIVIMTGCKKKETEDPVLNPVSMITSTVNGNEITVLWGAPSSGQPNAYKLYRNDLLYKTLNETSFSETVFEAGVYHYCVSVVYDDGESKKACTDAEIVDVPSDYAEIIAGIYVGDIDIPSYEETFENKTIALDYKSLNIITININDSIAPAGMNVPLNMNEDVIVSLSSDNAYSFSFETTTSIEFLGQILTFPLIGEGMVTGNTFVLNITVQTGYLDIVGKFTGYKQ